MAKRYNPPPNWPAPPVGFVPPPGWAPDPAWGPAPPGWKLWVDDRNWFLRHKILTGIGAFIVLMIAIGIASPSEDDTGTVATKDVNDQQSATPTTPAPETTTAKATPTKAAATTKAAAPTKTTPAKPASDIGVARRDGKFQFTVLSVKCGKTEIGSAYLNKKSQGKFCLVTMKVKNISDKPQTLFGSNQKMFVGKAEYAADDEAAIYLDDSKSFIEDINPGNSLTGVIVFDVPKNAKPTKLELHDSVFSGGVDALI